MLTRDNWTALIASDLMAALRRRAEQAQRHMPRSFPTYGLTYRPRSLARTDFRHPTGHDDVRNPDS